MRQIDMTELALRDVYAAYVACLNAQDWARLHRFVAEELRYNRERIGQSGYRRMLERNFEEIPDLYFDIELATVDRPYVAARLRFDCAPKGRFLGLAINGRRVVFFENVFYKFERDRICEVWSIVDKAAIEMQLEASSAS